MSNPRQSVIGNEEPQKKRGDGNGLQTTEKKDLTLIVDSLNHLMALFGKGSS